MPLNSVVRTLKFWKKYNNGKTNSRTAISDCFPSPSVKLLIFLNLKTKFQSSYVLALFTNFSVVDAMLPIIAKLNVIKRSDFVNTSYVLENRRIIKTEWYFLWQIEVLNINKLQRVIIFIWNCWKLCMEDCLIFHVVFNVDLQKLLLFSKTKNYIFIFLL